MRELGIKKPTPEDYQFADTYVKDDKIVSKLTRRTGTVLQWPADVEPIEGVVWVRWDDRGQEGHAYRHQINRR